MNHYGLARFGTASFKETNELRIRVWYGYCELFLNGARLTATYSLNFHPGDHLSLWAPGTPDARPEVRFSNLRVRPLAFGPPPGRKMPLERIEYFTERMADEPDNPLHRLDRADARFSVGKLAEAIDDYDQLLKANKDWQQVILKKGMAHADAGAYATAIEHYKRLLELPAIEEVHVTGNRFDSDGKWKQTLVRVPLYQVAALDRLAWLEATCQDAEFRNGKSAVEHAKQAIELSQKQNRECYLTLAAAYAEASNFAEARKVIKQAGQLAGKSQQALIAPIQAALDEKRPYREAAR
jgi:tetratricopeptide (TPR) repeat protein